MNCLGIPKLIGLFEEVDMFLFVIPWSVPCWQLKTGLVKKNSYQNTENICWNAIISRVVSLGRKSKAEYSRVAVSILTLLLRKNYLYALYRKLWWYF